MSFNIESVEEINSANISLYQSIVIYENSNSVTGPTGPSGLNIQGQTGPTGPIGPTGYSEPVEFPVSGNLIASTINPYVEIINNNTVKSIPSLQDEYSISYISNLPLNGFNGSASYGNALPTRLHLNSTCKMSSGTSVFGFNKIVEIIPGAFPQFFGLYFNDDNNIYGITDSVLKPEKIIGILNPNDMFNIISTPNQSNPAESMLYAYQNGNLILQQKFSIDIIKFFYTTVSFLTTPQNFSFNNLKEGTSEVTEMSATASTTTNYWLADNTNGGIYTATVPASVKGNIIVTSSNASETVGKNPISSSTTTTDYSYYSYSNVGLVGTFTIKNGQIPAYILMVGGGGNGATGSNGVAGGGGGGGSVFYSNVTLPPDTYTITVGGQGQASYIKNSNNNNIIEIFANPGENGNGSVGGKGGYISGTINGVEIKPQNYTSKYIGNGGIGGISGANGADIYSVNSVFGDGQILDILIGGGGGGGSSTGKAGNGGGGGGGSGNGGFAGTGHNGYTGTIGTTSSGGNGGNAYSSIQANYGVGGGGGGGGFTSGTTNYYGNGGIGGQGYVLIYFLTKYTQNIFETTIGVNNIVYSEFNPYAEETEILSNNTSNSVGLLSYATGLITGSGLTWSGVKSTATSSFRGLLFASQGVALIGLIKARGLIIAAQSALDLLYDAATNDEVQRQATVMANLVASEAEIVVRQATSSANILLEACKSNIGEIIGDVIEAVPVVGGIGKIFKWGSKVYKVFSSHAKTVAKDLRAIQSDIALAGGALFALASAAYHKESRGHIYYSNGVTAAITGLSAYMLSTYGWEDYTSLSFLLASGTALLLADKMILGGTMIATVSTSIEGIISFAKLVYDIYKPFGLNSKRLRQTLYTSSVSCTGFYETVNNNRTVSNVTMNGSNLESYTRFGSTISGNYSIIDEGAISSSAYGSDIKVYSGFSTAIGSSSSAGGGTYIDPSTQFSTITIPQFDSIVDLSSLTNTGTLADGSSFYGSISMGSFCGQTSQGNNTISIGYGAGNTQQQPFSTSIGYLAGCTGQGINSVAIGSLAGMEGQASQSIILNASSLPLNSSTSGFFVNPVSSYTNTENANLTNIIAYNNTTNEIGINQNLSNNLNYLSSLVPNSTETNSSRIALNNGVNNIENDTPTILPSSTSLVSGLEYNGYDMPIDPAVCPSLDEYLQTADLPQITESVISTTNSTTSTNSSETQTKVTSGAGVWSGWFKIPDGVTQITITLASLAAAGAYLWFNTPDTLLSTANIILEKGVSSGSIVVPNLISGQLYNLNLVVNSAAAAGLSEDNFGTSSTLYENIDSLTITSSNGTELYGNYYNTYPSNIAIGSNAGFTSQGFYGISIGTLAGQNTQGSSAVAIGTKSAQQSQGGNAVAIGNLSGQLYQGNSSIAIGNLAGQVNNPSNTYYPNLIFEMYKGNYADSIYENSLSFYQTTYPILTGITNNLTTFSTAINNYPYPGTTSGVNPFSIFWKGYINLSNTGTFTLTTDNNSTTYVWVGVSGQISTSNSSLYSNNSSSPQTYTYSGTSGYISLQFTYGTDGTDGTNGEGYIPTFNLSYSGGSVTYYNEIQGNVAIGNQASQYLSGSLNNSIGFCAGQNSQSSNSIAIGTFAGQNNQQQGAIAMGINAGALYQGTGSIAIGQGAGQYSQGINSIAIGNNAGNSQQSTNSIILNANPNSLNISDNGISAIGGDNNLTISDNGISAIGGDNSLTMENNSVILNSGYANLSLVSNNTTTNMSISPLLNSSIPSNTVMNLMCMDQFGQMYQTPLATIQITGPTGPASSANISIGNDLIKTIITIGESIGSGILILSAAYFIYNAYLYINNAKLGYMRLANNEVEMVNTEADELISESTRLLVCSGSGNQWQMNNGSTLTFRGSFPTSFNNKFKSSECDSSIDDIAAESSDILVDAGVTLTADSLSLAGGAATIAAGAAAVLGSLFLSNGAKYNSDGDTTVSGTITVEGNSSITGTYTATNVVYNSFTGPTGPQGEQGPTGPQGTPGFSTSTGATGPTGSVGPAGPQGLLSITGTYYGDYIYWNNYTSSWTTGNRQISIGSNAGSTGQGTNTVAIGYNAGNANQGAYAISIGSNAGYNNGNTGQAANSIVINASGNPLSSSSTGFFVNPVRNINSVVSNILTYNSSTSEISYSNNFNLQGPTGTTGPTGALQTYTFAGNWNGGVSYESGTIVYSNNNTYISLTGANNNPLSATGSWGFMTTITGPTGATGYTGYTGYTGPTGALQTYTFAGNWTEGVSYASGTVVYSNNNTYISLTGANNNPLSATGSWGFMTTITGPTGVTGYTGYTGYTGPTGALQTYTFAGNWTGGVSYASGTVVYSNNNTYISLTGSNNNPLSATGSWGFMTTITGPTGVTGYTGYTGYTGPQGIQGSTGPTGTSYWVMDNNNNIYYPTNTSNTGYSNSVIINNNLVVSQNCYALTFNATSDYRIKKDQQDIDLDVLNIDNLKPKLYENTLTNKKDIGFIAHELQKEIPFLVTGNKDEEEYQKINYIGLIGLLVKELQEQKKINKEILQELEIIKKKLN